jgi:hypothetical protein
MKLYSFGCGRHTLSGTYEEQRSAYAEVSRIREKIEGNDAFQEIKRQEQEKKPDSEELSVGTRIWLRKMDLVWEEYCRRTTKPQKPPE